VPVGGPFIPIAKKKLGVVNAEDFSSGVACGLSGRGNAVLERRSSCSRSAQGDEHAPLRSPSPPERNGIEWIGNDSEDFIYLFIYFPSLIFGSLLSARLTAWTWNCFVTGRPFFTGCTALQIMRARLFSAGWTLECPS
jgi:hypothetical protein